MILRPLDTLGNDSRSEMRSEIDDRANDRPFGRILARMADEVPVDLHEVRTALEHRLEAGMTVTDIVDGDRNATLPQTIDGAKKRRLINRRRLLANFDDEPRGIDALAIALAKKMADEVASRGQRGRMHIQRNPAFVVAGDMAQRGGDAEMIHLRLQTFAADVVKKRRGILEFRAARSAREALNRKQREAVGVRIDDRLEHGRKWTGNRRVA